MNNKEAVAILNTIYGMVSPEVQKAIDVANKALSRDFYTCSNCTHLIFKDFKHCEGECYFTHRIKSFYDRCDHEEEMS